MVNIDLRYFFQPPGFVDNVDYAYLWERRGVTRVSGTSTLPLEFSVLAAVTVPLTIHFARYAANRQVRWLAMLACGVALLALPAGVSRTGVVALAAALLVYMWNFKVRHLAVAVAAGAAAFLGYIAAFPGTATALWQTIVNSDEDPSVLHRTDSYALVGDTFRAHPVFGLGLGAVDPKEYRFLDNEWLWQIVQGGTVGVNSNDRAGWRGNLRHLRRIAHGFDAP